MFSMMKFRTVAAVALAVGVSLTAVNAYAFGLGDVTGAVGGGTSGGAAVDVGALVTQGKGLMGKFNSAFSNMTAAEGHTAQALGLKTDSEKLLALSQAYAAGNVSDSDQIARDVATTEGASKAIQDKLAEGGKVDAASKKSLLTAVPFYGKGIVEGAGLPTEFSNYAKSAQSGISSLKTNPLDAAKLTDGVSTPISVATKLPDLVSTFGQTSKNFVAFSQSNNVDVKGVADKLGGL